MINHPHRCLYVHIPKTAGNSVNRTFGTEWENHKDLQRYAREISPAIFASYYKFAIVRNPWERIFSDYNYQKKKSRARVSKLFLFKETGEKRKFCEWVTATLSDPHRYDPRSWGGEVSPEIHRWSPQVEWISLDGKIAVDRVLHLERLTEDFPGLCRHLGLPPMKLPHRNRRVHFHYSWYYDDRTRDLVGAYYAKDIEAFGYRFDSKLEGMRQFARSCAASLVSAVALVGGPGVHDAVGFASSLIGRARSPAPGPAQPRADLLVR
jgi:chondroitin 4-sulfotransferase 11